MDSERLWTTFKQRFNKVYSSLFEDQYRFSVFTENAKFVQQHNELFKKGHVSYSVALNHMSDMTLREFTHFYNGFRRTYNMTLPRRYLAGDDEVASSSLPQSVNWTARGAVTPVKNQGQCGSCWSFSATGSLEGQHFLKTGRLVSLSEQNLVDCSRSYGNNGCNGGLMDNAFQYVKENKGIDTEQSYPYEAEDDRCRFKRTNVGAHDKGYVDIPQDDEQALQKAVATVGPISVAIDAAHNSFMHYDGGVYDNILCGEQLDHGVLAVGYGTDQETGKAYWLVKNSWGPMWGEAGYVKMARNKNNQCGIASSASYPIVDKSGR